MGDFFHLFDLRIILKIGKFDKIFNRAKKMLKNFVQIKNSN